MEPIDSAIDRVRGICLALPEATEKVAWGEPTFRVRDRLFAMFASASNHHGAGRNSLWVNAPLGVQEYLVRTRPDLYFVPPYVGPKGWVGIDLTLGDDELRPHIVSAYCLVAPKRLVALLDDE